MPPTHPPFRALLLTVATTHLTAASAAAPGWRGLDSPRLRGRTGRCQRIAVLHPAQCAQKNRLELRLVINAGSVSRR